MKTRQPKRLGVKIKTIHSLYQLPKVVMAYFAFGKSADGRVERAPDLQAAVATLSTGPVAPSDKISASNATVIMRYAVCMHMAVCSQTIQCVMSCIIRLCKDNELMVKE